VLNFVSEHFDGIAAIAAVIAAVMHSQRDDPDFASVIVLLVILVLVIFVFFANSILPVKNIDFGRAVSELISARALAEPCLVVVIQAAARKVQRLAAMWKLLRLAGA
jgi:hypothetical protein